MRGTFLTRAALAVVAAAVSIGSMGAGPAGPAPKTVTIVIDSVAFGSTDVPVKIGDTVEWINKDAFDHTATAKSGAWDVAIPAGKKARVVMKKAGTAEYYCRFHPTMQARIVVATR